MSSSSDAPSGCIFSTLPCEHGHSWRASATITMSEELKVRPCWVARNDGSWSSPVTTKKKRTAKKMFQRKKKTSFTAGRVLKAKHELLAGVEPQCVASFTLPELPRNIAGAERPTKDDVVAAHQVAHACGMSTVTEK